MPVIPVWLAWTLIGLASSKAAIHFHRDSIDLFFMRVFRDIGRHKAYKRRYGGNDHALSTFLFQKDDPLLGIIDDDQREDDLPTYTAEELYELGNVDDFEDANGDEPSRRLLLSIFGRIYDVTRGIKFYGPGSSYSMFCGRDVTYALSTGCKTDKCLRGTIDELTEKQLNEGKRWLSFFQLHDKYPLVGKLDNNPMEKMMEEWIGEIIANKDREGAREMPPLKF